MVPDSVSIIIPAFNEEKNIGPAIEAALAAAKNAGVTPEIIVVDDGSSDKTAGVAARYTKKNPSIRLIRHPFNYGMGAAFRSGIWASTGDYITVFPGDNDTAKKSLQQLIQERKRADIISAYSVNPAARSWKRRVASKVFVISMNLLFGLNLRYFNGCFITTRKLLQSVPMYSNGFTAFAEAKVRLVKQGYSLKEIPFEHIGRRYGRSKAVALPTLFSSLYTIYVLLRDISFRR